MDEFYAQDLGCFIDSSFSIKFSKYYADDSTVSNEFKAIPTGACSGINIGLVDRHSVASSLNNCVGLGMNRPYTMAPYHIMTYFITVR
jgi:hypothetical protein